MKFRYHGLFGGLLRAIPPVVPDGGAYTTQLSANGLDVEVVATGGGVKVVNIMQGYLYYTNGQIVIHYAALRAGRPVPLFPHYGAIRQLHPQILPLPASVAYEFPSSGEIWTYLSAYIEKYTDESGGKLPLGLAGNGVVVPFPTAAVLLAMVKDYGAGVFCYVGTQLGTLAAGARLTLKTKELRNYGAADRNFIFINTTTAADAFPAGATVSAVYKGTLTNSNDDPVTGAPDYAGTLVDRTTAAEHTAGRGRYQLVTSAFDDEHEAVVHFSAGAVPPKRRYTLDPFEKWALFDGSLRLHYRNWYRSNFLQPLLRNESFVQFLCADIYPASQTQALADYPTAGTSITPPAPTLLTYAVGESKGLSRPTYDLDIQRLRFKLDRHTQDRYASDATRDIEEYRYAGADGVEEYIKRVICGELVLSDEDEVQGFTAQMVVARSYFLARWLAMSANPIAMNYAESDINETAAFQYHVIGGTNANSPTINTAVRRAVTGETFRRRLESVAAECRGIMVTHRGRIADTEFFAGEAAAHKTCTATDVTRAYKLAVHTKFGHGNCNVEHGRGLSQNGTTDLSERGLSFIQILHWYFYGVQLRNGYAQGDILTMPPAAHGWVVSAAPDNVPVDAVTLQDGRWSLATSPTDDEEWFLAHDCRASDFSQDVNHVAIPLNVDRRLIQRVQQLRFNLRVFMSIVGSITSPSEGVRIACDSPLFEAAAIQAFGQGKVTKAAAPNWDLTL